MTESPAQNEHDAAYHALYAAMRGFANDAQIATAREVLADPERQPMVLEALRSLLDSRGGELDLVPGKELVDTGLLLEANRQFFHPRDLALTLVTFGEESEGVSVVQGIARCPNGVRFGSAATEADARDRMSKIQAAAKLIGRVPELIDEVVAVQP